MTPAAEAIWAAFADLRRRSPLAAAIEELADQVVPQVSLPSSASLEELTVRHRIRLEILAIAKELKG